MLKSRFFLTSLLVISVALLSSCAPREVIKEIIVTQEVEVEKEVIVEKEVEKEVIVTVEVETQEEDETQVIYGMYQEPQILNPLLASQVASWETTTPIIEGLISVNPQGEYYPVLAKEVPSEANGLVVIEGDGAKMTVTYNLHEDILWSTGEPFTCDDVRFTWEAIMDPDSGVVSRTDYQNITSVECSDDHTAIVTFEPFYGPYLNVFGSILPKNRTGDPKEMESWVYNWNPIGTGPFRITEWVPGDHITMVKNENYRDYPEKPYIDKFIIRIIPSREAGMAMLQTGEIDFLWKLDESVIPDLQDKPGILVYSTPSSTIERLIFNLTERPGGPNNIDWTLEENLPDPADVPHPLLGDLRVREALQAAINKKELTEVFLYGAATVGTKAINIGWGGSGCDIPESIFDPENAKILLDEAGFTDQDGDGVRECHGCLYADEGTLLRLKIQTTSGHKLREQVSQLIIEYWAEIGVEGYLETIPATVLFATFAAGSPRKIGDFDILLYSTGPWIEPHRHMSAYYGDENWPTGENGGSGQNYSRWHNPKDAELNQAGTLADTEKRADLYCEVMKAISEEIPQIFLYNRADVHAAREGLMGIEISPWGSENWNIADWYWEGQE